MIKKVASNIEFLLSYSFQRFSLETRCPNVEIYPSILHHDFETEFADDEDCNTPSISIEVSFPVLVDGFQGRGEDN